MSRVALQARTQPPAWSLRDRPSLPGSKASASAGPAPTLALQDTECPPPVGSASTPEGAGAARPPPSARPEATQLEDEAEQAAESGASMPRPVAPVAEPLPAPASSVPAASVPPYGTIAAPRAEAEQAGRRAAPAGSADAAAPLQATQPVAPAGPAPSSSGGEQPRRGAGGQAASAAGAPQHPAEAVGTEPASLSGLAATAPFSEPQPAQADSGSLSATVSATLVPQQAAAPAAGAEETRAGPARSCDDHQAAAGSQSAAAAPPAVTGDPPTALPEARPANASRGVAATLVPPAASETSAGAGGRAGRPAGRYAASGGDSAADNELAAELAILAELEAITEDARSRDRARAGPSSRRSSPGPQRLARAGGRLVAGGGGGGGGGGAAAGRRVPASAPVSPAERRLALQAAGHAKGRALQAARSPATNKPWSESLRGRVASPPTARTASRSPGSPGAPRVARGGSSSRSPVPSHARPRQSSPGRPAARASSGVGRDLGATRGSVPQHRRGSSPTLLRAAPKATRPGATRSPADDRLARSPVRKSRPALYSSGRGPVAGTRHPRPDDASSQRSARRSSRSPAAGTSRTAARRASVLHSPAVATRSGIADGPSSAAPASVQGSPYAAVIARHAHRASAASASATESVGSSTKPRVHVPRGSRQGRDSVGTASPSSSRRRERGAGGSHGPQSAASSPRELRRRGGGSDMVGGLPDDFGLWAGETRSPAHARESSAGSGFLTTAGEASFAAAIDADGRDALAGELERTCSAASPPPPQTCPDPIPEPPRPPGAHPSLRAPSALSPALRDGASGVGGGGAPAEPMSVQHPSRGNGDILLSPTSRAPPPPMPALTGLPRRAAGTRRDSSASSAPRRGSAAGSYTGALERALAPNIITTPGRADTGSNGGSGAPRTPASPARVESAAERELRLELEEAAAVLGDCLPAALREHWHISAAETSPLTPPRPPMTVEPDRPPSPFQVFGPLAGRSPAPPAASRFHERRA